jgi:uncharacterized glyoxalase superfamily protein PhnB
MHKPAGYPDVSAYLVVEDAQATLDFVQAVFAGTPLRVIRDEAGIIRHAEARIGDSVVMMGQMEGGPAAHVHLYLADAEAAFARAVAQGAVVVQDLMRRDDGDLRGGVRDGNGTTWWIAREDG